MRLRTTLTVLCLLAAALFVAPAARAAEIRNGDRVVIAAGEVIDDDLIVSAETVIIDGTVTGDLIATGTNVTLNGLVQGSALLAGQTLRVAGQVDGSLYAGGYAVTLDEGAVVGRNAYFGGYSVATRPDSLVNRDFYAAGLQMLHDGIVTRDLAVALSALHVNGIVGGDVRGDVTVDPNAIDWTQFAPNMPYRVETLSPGLVVGPTAEIGGEVAVRETVVQATATPEPETGFAGLPVWLSNRLGYTIGLLLVGLLVVAAAPRFLPALSDQMRRRPLPALGWGALVYLFLFPVAIVTGLVLVGLLTLAFGVLTLGQFTAAVLGLTGSAFAFALFAFLFFTYAIAWLVAGHLLGGLILGRAGLNQTSRVAQFAWVALGVVLLQAARAVPYLGFFVALLVGTLALGAAFDWLLERRRGPAKAPAPTPQLAVGH